ncbi:hypothetical protein GCM10011512_27160 [Tersicoccus solisilvae]|uniref:Magnesium transporter NIPA n=1 Tax=Tersicoccus solisilvae TaxID=1882339 RepID=A0ABQ1PKK3_9MICC|nr:DMT family transporter [Tersicoccus solisilvae]GGC98808.1 hypothetical protein GCM10011512_27160 [Tersicoccus solisilvae]
MRPEYVIAIACALASAVCLAYGSQRQGSAVQAQTGGLSLHGRGAMRLLANPRWVLGTVLMGLGMGLNIAALANAPLMIVQPLGAVALVITTVVNAREQNLKLNRVTIFSIVLCMFGSTLFVLMALLITNPAHEGTTAQELTTCLLLAVVLLIFGSLAVGFRGRLNAFIYIVGAGVLFGFVAVLSRLLFTHLFAGGGVHLLGVPVYLYIAIVAAGGLGIWFVQSAYSHGPPDLVIAGLTVIDPMVGIGIGIAILGEARANPPALVAIAMVIAAVSAIVGVVMLSRYHPDVISRKAEKRHAKNAAADRTGG